MEAYESIMNSTRAPFSILPKPIDEDGNTVTTTGGADDFIGALVLHFAA